MTTVKAERLSMAGTARSETLNRLVDRMIRERYDAAARRQAALTIAQDNEEMLRRAAYRLARTAGRSALGRLEGLVAYAAHIDKLTAQLGYAALATAMRQVELDEECAASSQQFDLVLGGRIVSARSTRYNRSGFRFVDGADGPPVFAVKGQYFGASVIDNGEGALFIGVYDREIVRVPLFDGSSTLPLATIRVGPIYQA